MTRAELEARRFEAGEMFESELSQAEVARQLEVTRTTASRWYRMFLNSRMASTKATGRPPRIDHSALSVLFSKRRKWTQKSFADAIKQQLGIEYHEDTAGRILREFRGPVRQAAVGSTERAG